MYSGKRSELAILMHPDQDVWKEYILTFSGGKVTYKAPNINKGFKD